MKSILLLIAVAAPLCAQVKLTQHDSQSVAVEVNGKPFTEASIGMTLAVRNLMTDLRSSGEITGGPRGFTPRDRSTFLSALDQTIRRIARQRANQQAQQS